MKTRRTFKELIRELGDAKVCEIVQAYARSNQPKSVIAKEEGISEDMVRKMIEYTIENYLIPDSVVHMIVRKAHCRQIRYSGYEVVTKSDLYYDRILIKRIRVNQDRMKCIVRCYIENPDTPNSTLAEMMECSQITFGILLKSAIIYGVCTDFEVRQIVRIAKRKNPSEKNVTTLNLYQEVRRIYRLRTQELQQYEFRISTYDEYESCGDGESKEELEKMRDALADELRLIRNNY